MVVPQSGNTVVIVTNRSVVDSGLQPIQESVQTLQDMAKRGVRLILCTMVSSDSEEALVREALSSLLSIPPKNLIFFEQEESIYSICRQIEPTYVVDTFADSYNNTARFFENRYFLFTDGALSALVK